MRGDTPWADCIGYKRRFDVALRLDHACWTAEETRETWNKSARLGFLSESYKQYLRDLSAQIRAIREGQGKEQAGVQFVNLSPAWRDQSVYAYFNNSGPSGCLINCVEEMPR